ncbi:hypothetical protein MKEN_00261200 [Mycena kentingensis (nom. inval.)]|nr:hypothetical protein MKEN_00261200 [Mycena kentingensis (nom. inval.)]
MPARDPYAGRHYDPPPHPPRSNYDIDDAETFPSESGSPSPATYQDHTHGFYENDGSYDPYPPQDSDSEASGPAPTSYADYPTTAAPIRDAYPAWSAERNIPLSKEEIEDVFLDLAQKFGFQKDNERNMSDFLLQLLDSRASRMSPNQALITLHADYIGGQQANYRKWYFAAQLDLDDAVGRSHNPGLTRLQSKRRPNRRAAHEKSLNSAMERWRQAMHNMSQYDRLRQVALYLLCWGEAAQVRFCPEALCFIFKCADDYYRSPECQNRPEPLPQGHYLRTVIKPLYRFIRDQGYELSDGKYVRRERDHEDIIGYDDVNQLFWYPEGIHRIILNDMRRLVDVPQAQRFLAFERIDWNRVFFKTYYEKRSFGHLLVNFNRIWVIHVAMYWFYTSYNSPTVYAIRGTTSRAMTWRAGRTFDDAEAWVGLDELDTDLMYLKQNQLALSILVDWNGPE